MEIITILEELGLTKQESRCYLALYQLTESRVGGLSKSARIATANIYPVLNSLIAKGLVTYRISNNIKVFIANSPDALSALVEQRQKRLEQERLQATKIISLLKKLPPTEHPFARYKYFESINGIRSMWHDISNNSSLESEWLIHTGKVESYYPLQDFYASIHKDRISKKISARMIFPTADKVVAPKRSRLRRTKVRTYALHNLGEWGVCGDYVFMQHIAENRPYGLLINDKIFAQTFTHTFNELWKLSKELK
jgi:sugar-specific transcriptional regulator TrmB